MWICGRRARRKDPWTLRVHAEPARTDRPARGFGSFVLRGQWLQRDGSTTLDVKLEQSELGDMLTLFNGYESGINGRYLGRRASGRSAESTSVSRGA